MSGIGATHALSESLAIAGTRELGGPVTAGRSFIINERGDEVFTPNQSGTITPNHRINERANITFAPVIQAWNPDEILQNKDQIFNELWNMHMDRMNEEGLSYI